MNCKYFALGLCLTVGYASQAKAWGETNDLYNAAVVGNIQAIEAILSRGYSIDTPDLKGQTALCRAYHNRQWNAYSMLMKYGANTNAGCMAADSGQAVDKDDDDNSALWFVGGAVVVGGGVAAIAATKHKHSHKSDTEPAPKPDPKPDPDPEPDPQPDPDPDPKPDPDPEPEPEDFTYYTVDDFRKKDGIGYPEFSGTGVTEGYEKDGVRYKTIGFLDGIRAAEAYSHFYGHDSKDNLISKLNKEHNIVAVIDTGVEVNHVEFLDSEGKSKVTGKNFEYGICRNSDNTNCWKIENYSVTENEQVVEKQRRLLYDGKGNVIMNMGGYDAGVLDAWAEKYAADYDRDEHIDDPNPQVGYDLSKAFYDDYAHGTHVAGVIGANWNRDENGMMGVAFSNTDIYALRWDMVGPLSTPVDEAINKKALVANMSFGIGISAGLISEYIDFLWYNGNLTAAANTIKSYRKSTGADNKSVTDGMIWVMGAGNENQDEPTLMNGVKNLGEQTISGTDEKVNFDDLMMLVVVAATVEMNDDGTVKSYKRSSFSNACGSTARYCIAAPSGDRIGDEMSAVFSPAPLKEGATENNAYAPLEGTSQATPTVSGSIAFMNSAFPYLHSSEIIEILIETANMNGEGYDHSTPHEDKVYGAGLLDLGKAVTTYLEPEGEGGTMSAATVEGASVYTPYVDMGDAQLIIPSNLEDTIAKLLPGEITIFDRYHRPFNISTSRYITTTHGGYKALKNELGSIMPSRKQVEKTQGNLSFSYASSIKYGNEGQLGFADVSFNSDKIKSGFFFSENTRYGGVGKEASDMQNPYMSFNKAFGTHISYNITPKYSFKFEAVGGENGLYDG
ncbi:MAG: S8 family serine peptidase, partial [Alphaproteobacteria bacterium]|nr:S8 family serine peptidase [Alphaproteobacteria bacterium]